MISVKNIFGKKPDAMVTLRNQINKIYSLVPQDFGGGCSVEKALVMAIAIKEFNLQETTDIGVYRGRSLFPQAIAHKLFSKGKVYGVDPYSKEDANQKDFPQLQKELDKFVAETNFQKLHDEVSNIINEKYKRHCVLIRKKSSDAAIDFKKNQQLFGLVHIDGNHDTKFVMEDTTNYLPLLTEKSFIVLDDISWQSVLPAFELLKKEMVFILELKDAKNDFALFGKGITGDEIENLRRTIEKAII